jgi:uridine kinase
MKTTTIFCKNTNKSYHIPFGSTLQEIKEIIYPMESRHILGALVNNELQGLQYIIITPAQIKFIDHSTLEGYQIYCRSLVFILYHAITELFPNYKLRVEYPISNGLYCNIINLKKLD